MKWLTLPEIKEQLRIEADFTLEDQKLTMYGDSAEEVLMEVTRRTYDDFIENYGKIPTPIREVSLMLVTVSYETGSAVSLQQLYSNPTFDMKVKPYMRLADGPMEQQPIERITIGSDAKIEFTAELPDGLKLGDVDFGLKVINVSEKDVSEDYTKADCISKGDGESYVVLVDTEQLGVGRVMLQLTVQIPDTDYTSGYRKEVIKINPHIAITG
jgi:hypothetical protein